MSKSRRLKPEDATLLDLKMKGGAMSKGIPVASKSEDGRRLILLSRRYTNLMTL